MTIADLLGPAPFNILLTPHAPGAPVRKEGDTIVMGPAVITLGRETGPGQREAWITGHAPRPCLVEDSYPGTPHDCEALASRNA